ncbi:MAG: gamma-glutamylcyclotransferase family protein [bacterium]|nr:gamma-glutamylcyclotransferase family protein [bacterium]
MVFVFVYGTLKQGFANHHYLAGLEMRPGWVEGYQLHQGPGYPYAAPGQSRIYGEVYPVDDALLAQLDALEETPHYYRRIGCQVHFGGGETCPAYLYVRPEAAGLPVIPQGKYNLT